MGVGFNPLLKKISSRLGCPGIWVDLFCSPNRSHVGGIYHSQLLNVWIAYLHWVNKHFGSIFFSRSWGWWKHCNYPPWNEHNHWKWWLEDYVPFGKAYFQGRTVILKDGIGTFFFGYSFQVIDHVASGHSLRKVSVNKPPWLLGSHRLHGFW